MQRHKKHLIICLFIVLAVGSIAGIVYFKDDKNTGDKAYPYDDSSKYVPQEISHSEHENTDLIYNQESQVNKYIQSLYGAMYDDSFLKRDCYPVYSETGSVSFSRKSDESDTDANRYDEMLAYIGQANEKLFISLTTLPQNQLNTIRCMIFQDGTDDDISAVSAQVPIYQNCDLSIMISQDFDAISNPDIKNYIQGFRDILNSDKASSIEGCPASLNYVYQTRYTEELDSTEERYVYYLFFKTNDLEYLLQFTSNYTILDGNETAYGVVGKRQEECRSFFEEYAMSFAKTYICN